MNKKHLYAFYGSLRNGMYNHAYMSSGMEYQKTTEITGFKLYSLGSYPCVIKTGNTDDKLTIDLFTVTGNMESRIHNMELGAGYDYEEIQVDGESYGIYVYDSSALGSVKDRYVPSGDWVKHLQDKDEVRAREANVDK